MGMNSRRKSVGDVPNRIFVSVFLDQSVYWAGNEDFGIGLSDHLSDDTSLKISDSVMTVFVARGNILS